MKPDNCGKTQCGNEIIDKTSKTFEFLSHPIRLKIICMLSKSPSLTAGIIVENLDLPQNLVSHHIGILRKRGIIDDQRNGKFIEYSLNQTFFSEFKTTIKQIFEI